MRFTKMHGAGNDFVVINAIEEDVPLSSASCLARTLCLSLIHISEPTRP